MTGSRQPTLFLSHGGGPCFWVRLPPPFDQAEIDQMREYLAHVLDGLPARPSAMLVVEGTVARYDKDFVVLLTNIVEM